MQFHSFLIKNAFEKNPHVRSGLIDLYSKCCRVLEAKKVFEEVDEPELILWNLNDADKVFVRMPERNSVSYNSIIAGYAQHGLGCDALELFNVMLDSKNEPTSITFISVLSACTHTGQVDEGRHYFNSMKKDHNFDPSEEHYSCMINLLSRTGKFAEVDQLIKTMPFDPGVIGWATLLGGCRTHGNKYFRHTTGQLHAICKDLATYISPNRHILHKYANVDVSLGSWLIGLDIEHIDERSMCCGTPPDCEWKLQAGNAYAASFDLSCNDIRKSMGVLVKSDKGTISLLVKGGVESLLERSSYI